jgi:hypothetical protein
MTTWNHSRCEACGYTSETMTFPTRQEGILPQYVTRCPRCQSDQVTWLGYPVRGSPGVYTNEPEPDLSEETARYVASKKGTLRS